jgi:hypothetical protein
MYNENGDKMFKQYRPDGNGGYASSMEGIERLPYRLPFWKDLDSIVIVEGEKDVDTLSKYGVAATCNSGGAKNRSPELNKWFTGKQFTSSQITMNQAEIMSVKLWRK